MLKREITAIALFKLFPDGGWGINDATDTFSKIYWQAGTAPITESEFLTAYEEAKIQYKLEETLQNRRLNYPAVGDQLDDLFKAGAFSEEMAAKIQAIKDKYPKV